MCPQRRQIDRAKLPGQIIRDCGGLAIEHQFRDDLRHCLRFVHNALEHTSGMDRPLLGFARVRSKGAEALVGFPRHLKHLLEILGGNLPPNRDQADIASVVHRPGGNVVEVPNLPPQPASDAAVECFERQDVEAPPNAPVEVSGP